jgi:5-methylcytosine-specific restriction endonuclease McrA
MAKDVLELLKATHSWIDPNLVILANECNNDTPSKETKNTE